MPIPASAIERRFSGGAANSNGALSIGGAKSSEVIATASLNALFDQVDGQEALDGDVEYRCMYIHNADATRTAQNAVVYILNNTVANDTTLDIGLGIAGIDGTEGVIGDEDAAPAGVTFSSADSLGNALPIGDLAPGEHIGLWVRRMISADAAANNLDSAVIRVRYTSVA